MTGPFIHSVPQAEKWDQLWLFPFLHTPIHLQSIISPISDLNIYNMKQILLHPKWSKVAQSCPTLCDPMDCSLPGSSVHGIFQARVLEWVAISFSRESSQPRDWTRVSHIAGRRFIVWATREDLLYKSFLICCSGLARYLSGKRVCLPVQEPQEMWVWPLGQEDPLEKETATNSSILAWRIHGQRTLADYSPWGHKELDMTEHACPQFAVLSSR